MMIVSETERCNKMAIFLKVLNIFLLGFLGYYFLDTMHILDFSFPLDIKHLDWNFIGGLFGGLILATIGLCFVIFVITLTFVFVRWVYRGCPE
jgi:hypothetical protein